MDEGAAQLLVQLAPRASLRARLLLLLAVSGLSAVGAELFLRTVDLGVAGVNSVTEELFRSVPGIFYPAQDVLDRRRRDLAHHVTINSLGYRGRELQRHKPDGERRILFLGDSLVFGQFVDDADTLPAQLERALAQPCSGVRVINAGSPGSTIDTHAALAERGLVVEPDLVLLQFFENDLPDLSVPTLWQRLAAKRAKLARFPLSLAYPLARRTALGQLALRVHALHDPPPAPPAALGASQLLRDRYAAQLLALRDLLVRRGVPLVLTAFPSVGALEGSQPGDALHWLQALAARERIPFVELLTPLRESGLAQGDLYLVPRDWHPAPGGYRVAAAALHAGLLRDPGARAALCPARPRGPGEARTTIDATPRPVQPVTSRRSRPS